MIHPRRILAFPILLILAISPGRGTDLINTFQSAEKTDPDYLIAKHRYRVVQEVLKQANGELLPKVTFDFTQTKTRQNIVETGNAIYALGETNFSTRDYSLNLTQPVLDLPSIVGRRMRRREVERSEVELEDAKQELALKTATRYLEALAAGDNLVLVQAELDAVEEHYKLAQVRSSRGLAPLTDLYDASARLEAVKALRVEARNKQADALQALREITGEMPVRLASLRPDFRLVKPVPEDGDEWVNSALEANLGMAIQRHIIDVAHKEIELRRAGRWPTIDLVGRHNRRDSGGSLFGGGSDIKTTDLFFRFSVPLYDGGNFSSRQREATELETIARLELTKRERAVVRDTWAAYSGLLGTIYRVRALAKAIEAQKLTLAAKKSGFESGLYTGIAVLDSEHAVNQAKLNYAQARYDYLVYMLRLRRAVGALGINDLKRLNGWLGEVRPAAPETTGD